MLNTAPKNIKWAICQHLSYGDILAFGQTCKDNQKCISDNNFWNFLLSKRFNISPNMTNSRYKFFDMIIKNIINPYVRGCFDIVSKHIEKYDNVVLVDIDKYGCGHLHYYFLIQCNDDNQVLLEYKTDFTTGFLYDMGYSELVLIKPGSENMKVINTRHCTIISDSILDTNLSLFEFDDMFDDRQTWLRKDNIWLYDNDKYHIVLDMVKSSIVAQTL